MPSRATWAVSFDGSSLYTSTPVWSPSVWSCFIAAGRRRSAATSSGAWPAAFRWRAILADAVVLPAPFRPTMSITEGGDDAGTICFAPPPRTSVSSSLVILTTCWPGLRLLRTSSPRARSRIRDVSCRATRKLTSASRSAIRTSRSAASTSFSVSLPLLLSLPKVAPSFSVSASNIRCLYLAVLSIASTSEPSAVSALMTRTSVVPAAATAK